MNGEYTTWPHVPRIRRPHPSGGESMTKQADTPATDINAIVKRFIKSGILDGMRAGEAKYGDFTGYQDYHGALSRVRDAEREFMLHPAEVREKFDNDVGKFLDALADPEQYEQLVEDGLPEELDPSKADPPAGQAGSEAEEPQSGDEGSTTTST